MSHIMGRAASAILAVFVLEFLAADPARAQPAFQEEASVLEAARLADGPRLVQILGETPDPAVKALVQTLLAASRLDADAARVAAERYRESPFATAAGTATAWSALAAVEFADGDYRRAAISAAEWRRALTASGELSDQASAAQTEAVAAILAGAPSQQLSLDASGPSGTVPTTVDAAGLLRADMFVDGQVLSTVLDTGANLSVLSESAARRLKLTMLAGQASVGSSSRDAVPVRIVLADTVEIAGAVLYNVAFLVIDDAALTFPVAGGYRIDAILGMPVFRAMGRITFDRSGVFSWGPSGADHGETNVYASGSDLHVVVDVNGAPLPLHLDTGATASMLSAAAAPRYRGLYAGDAQASHTAGAGGVKEGSARPLAPVTLELAGTTMCHPDLTLAAGDPAEADDFGTLGQDVLKAFASYTVDLRAMTFSLGSPSGDGVVSPGRCL